MLAPQGEGSLGGVAGSQMPPNVNHKIANQISIDMKSQGTRGFWQCCIFAAIAAEVLTAYRRAAVILQTQQVLPEDGLVGGLGYPTVYLEKDQNHHHYHHHHAIISSNSISIIIIIISALSSLPLQDRCIMIISPQHHNQQQCHHHNHHHLSDCTALSKHQA